MSDGTKDDLKGRTKEAAGSLTDDQSLKNEGKVDRASGTVKDKVGAGEIEVALLEHPGVREAAVTAEPDDDLGERIVAWVVAEAEPPEERELIDHVAAELAPHKRPREVRFLDELPRNAMGKVVKAQLGSDG